MSDHILTPKAKTALDSGPAAAIHYLRQRPEFIWHHDARSIADRIELRLHGALHDDEEGTDHFLVVGPTGNGKSRLMKTLAAKYASPQDPTQSCMSIPVLYTRMAPSGTPLGYLRGVLDELGARYTVSNSFDQLYPLFVRLLGRLGVKVLVIDELQHIAIGKRDDKARMLNMIKDIGEQLRCVIVGCGLPDALYAMRWDAQLDRRFEPLPLNRWTVGLEFCRMLDGLEQTLPLPEPSDLGGEASAVWIADASEGTMKETQRLIRRAAMKAIQDGRPSIDLGLLKGLDWIKPSLRRKQAEVMLSADRVPLVP